ncbi:MULTISPECIES: Arc family DNA-binding protein [Aminobacter]|uniref:Arc family DNA-binding protein n=1 Tax=Aminobacter TaxID=31988 RepID=UPI000D35CCF0|nr:MULTISPECIES: Arc family DNA-binding protein [Aminobacter]AWC25622.1 Mnt [Aminobacter sp. MSH1]
MTKKPGRGSEQFMVRLPDGMREALKADAEASGRSMNAEIVARLEEHPGLLRMAQQLQYCSMERVRLEQELADTKRYLTDAVNELQRALAAPDGAAEALARKDQQIAELERLVAILQEQSSKLSAACDLYARTLDIFERTLNEAAEGDDTKLKRFVEGSKIAREEERLAREKEKRGGGDDE